jgi:hypothetical protein
MSDDAAADDAATDTTASDDGSPTPAIVRADESTDDESTRQEPDPTPQPDALRRQQLGVGVGVAALAGVAVVVAGIQQFPGLPLLVYILFGMAASTLLFGLLLASMFAGEAE